jgi:hypothetical protein
MVEKEQNRQSKNNLESLEARVLDVLSRRSDNTETSEKPETKEPETQEKPTNKKAETTEEDKTKPDFWQPTEQEKGSKEVPFATEEEGNKEEPKADLPLEAQAGAEEAAEEQTNVNPGLAPPTDEQIDNGKTANKLEKWANEIRNIT